MTTLENVLSLKGRVFLSESELALDRAARDLAVRQCYSAGNATMAELAKATGLTVQRISQIVRDER